MNLGDPGELGGCVDREACIALWLVGVRLGLVAGFGIILAGAPVLLGKFFSMLF